MAKMIGMMNEMVEENLDEPWYPDDIEDWDDNNNEDYEE